MRLLVTGASGQLGSHLLQECRNHSIHAVAWSGRQQGELFGYPLRSVDLSNADALVAAFHEARPDVLVHTAAMTVLADCLRDRERARLINSHSSALLAELADAAKIPMLFISTDMVFDGESAPYREEDNPNPLSFYGLTKTEGEQAVLLYPRNLVVRVPLLFGPTLIGRPTFFDQQVDALRQGQRLTLFHDEWRTPLSFTTAARALLALTESGLVGRLHLAGPERLSRLEMGQRLAAFLGCDPSSLVSLSRKDAATTEPRPRDISLDASKWRSLFPRHEWPNLEELLAQWLRS
jgi:dTDP-4-dehydrorhamnose reductase